MEEPRTPGRAIADLISRYGSGKAASFNEATTRLILVNEILRWVLGWDTDEFTPEELVPAWSGMERKSKREWLDYHLRHADAIRLVVEAKRAGKTFSLPTTKKQRKLPLVSLSTNHGQTLGSTIAQAQKYCWGVGTYGFVVTNGFQWVASLAFAHNVRQEDLQAVVYYDLEDIQTNLQEFIEYLSPAGLADQRLMSAAISGRSLVPNFARRLNDALLPATADGKNYIATQMRSLMGLCFSDLTSADHAKMLEDCYVSSEATDSHLKQLEAFVSTNLPRELAEARKIDRSSTENPFRESQVGYGESLLVIGRAGSGKSTFIAITRRRLAMNTRTTGVVLHIDLQPRTQIHAVTFDHDRLVDEVCRDILEQANYSYPTHNPFEHALLREIFSGEIRRLQQSMSAALRGSPEEERRIDDLIQDHLKRPSHHLKAYLGYLDKKGVPALVLLDNVDRGTPEFEKVVFQLAQTLSTNTNATIVTSLRETTYQDGKSRGFLDVGRHNVLTISPPPFVEVAKKRFDYARNQLEKDSRLSKKFDRVMGEFPRERVFDFADIMSEMILGHGEAIRDCIQSLAGTNVRLALELLEIFATSPNTNINRLFSDYRHQSNHQTEIGTSVDIFLRSVMRNNSLRYDESSSHIVNVFQASSKQLVSHFTAVRMLQFLHWKSQQVRESTDSTVNVLTVHLGSLGHSSGAVMDVLAHLGKHGLVNSLSRPEPPWDMKDVVRIGAAGRYYLHTLLINREYVHGITDDTVVYDEQASVAMEHIHKDPNRTWPIKYQEKARILLLYLARHEKQELNRLGSRDLWPKWLVPVAESLGTRFYGKVFSRDLATSSKKHSK